MRFKPIAYKGDPGALARRMCGNKRKYETKEEAEKDNKDKVYPCPQCGKFHRASERRKGKR